MFSVLAVIMATAVLLAATGCSNPQSKLQTAKEAENSGDHRKAANIYAATALDLSPAIRLHEAQKGKMLPLARWISEVDKYMAWLTENAAPRDNSFREALDGLTRNTEKFESDNTATITTTKNLDSLNAFAPEWNKAFNPPPSGGPDDWNAVIRRAHEHKFSIIRFASPRDYVYEISIVSRRNARRVNFTLYSETEVFVPLTPGDYSVVMRSTVEFQKGKSWTSDYNVFNLTMPDPPVMMNMEMRTRVARRD